MEEGLKIEIGQFVTWNNNYNTDILIIEIWKCKAVKTTWMISWPYQKS